MKRLASEFRGCVPGNEFMYGLNVHTQDANNSDNVPYYFVKVDVERISSLYICTQAW